MNDSSNHLEDCLRRLAPARCDQLTEETFYRAGWNAALQSISQPVPSLDVRTTWRQRAAVSFGSGILCGLVFCAAAVGAWRITQGDAADVGLGQAARLDPESSHSGMSDAVAERRSTEPPRTPEPPSVAEAEEPAGRAPSIVTAFLPWHWGPRFPSGDANPLAGSMPLSRAARHQWSRFEVAGQLHSTESTGAGVNSSDTPQGTRNMRVFPLRESDIEDLL